MVPILEKHKSGLAAISPDHQIENLHSQIDKLKHQLNSRSKGKTKYCSDNRNNENLDPNKKTQIKNFDQQLFIKKNEAVLRLHPENLREKLFKKNRTQTSKLTKAMIGEILTKRNNEIVDLQNENPDQVQDNQQGEEKSIRDKNAKV